MRPATVALAPFALSPTHADPQTMTDTASVNLGETFSALHAFTPETVRAFSLAMGDTNPLHLDADVAARSRYGQLIASGTHTGALLMGLTASHFSKRSPVVGVSFTIDFKRPVFATARVTLEWTVTAVRPHRGGKGQMVDLVGSLRDEADVICVAARGTVLVGLDG